MQKIGLMESGWWGVGRYPFKCSCASYIFLTWRFPSLLRWPSVENVICCVYLVLLKAYLLCHTTTYYYNIMPYVSVCHTLRDIRVWMSLNKWSLYINMIGSRACFKPECRNKVVGSRKKKKVPIFVLVVSAVVAEHRRGSGFGLKVKARVLGAGLHFPKGDDVLSRLLLWRADALSWQKWKYKWTAVASFTALQTGWIAISGLLLMVLDFILLI